MEHLEKEYCDMLSRVQPRETFETELLTTLLEIQNEGKKPKRKVRKKIIRRQMYQAAVCGICCISMILIGMMTPVSAAIQDMYQRFYQNVINSYGNNTQNDKIAIDQEAQTKNGSKIYIKDGVLTSKGMSICYEVKEKEVDVYPGEIQLKAENGVEVSMHQTAYMPASGKKDNKKYFASFEADDIDEINKLLKNKVTGSMEFLEETQDGEVKESLVDFSFKAESIYPLKTLKLNQDWMKTKKAGYYRISKITMDVWYMKVEYDWKTEANGEFPAFELSDENGKEYVSLGAEIGESQKGKLKGTIFYELLDKESKKMIFSPIQYIEEKNGEQKEEKLSGKSIRISKEDVSYDSESEKSH